MLGLTSDFLCGGKGVFGMRMTHHDLQDFYRDLFFVSIFGISFVGNKVLKFVRNGIVHSERVPSF